MEIELLASVKSLASDALLHPKGDSAKHLHFTYMYKSTESTDRTFEMFKQKLVKRERQRTYNITMG
jgi:hypothetical protein